MGGDEGELVGHGHIMQKGCDSGSGVAGSAHVCTSLWHDRSVRRPASSRTKRPDSAPGIARLHRSVVGRGHGRRRSDTAGAQFGVGAQHAAGHRNSPCVHPRSGVDGAIRRRDGLSRPGPLRFGHRFVIGRHRRALERCALRGTVQADPRHGAVREGGAHGREDHGGLRLVLGEGVPPRPGARGARAGARRRASRRNAQDGRS